MRKLAIAALLLAPLAPGQEPAEPAVSESSDQIAGPQPSEEDKEALLNQLRERLLQLDLQHRIERMELQRRAPQADDPPPSVCAIPLLQMPIPPGARIRQVYLTGPTAPMPQARVPAPPCPPRQVPSITPTPTLHLTPPVVPPRVFIVPREDTP